MYRTPSPPPDRAPSQRRWFDDIDDVLDLWWVMRDQMHTDHELVSYWRDFFPKWKALSPFQSWVANLFSKPRWRRWSHPVRIWVRGKLGSRVPTK